MITKNYYLTELYDVDNKDFIDGGIQLNLINKYALSLEKCENRALKEFTKIYKKFGVNCIPDNHNNKINIIQDNDKMNGCPYNEIILEENKGNLVFKFYKYEKKSNTINFVSKCKYDIIKLLGFGTSGGINANHEMFILQEK